MSDVNEKQTPRNSRQESRNRSSRRSPRERRRDGAPDRDDMTPELEDRVVFINRCSKVVKGGRRFSFSAVVVVGDRQGNVGFGFGKANEVAEAIRKSNQIARQALFPVVMWEKTIPHEVMGSCDGGRVLLRPAAPGTGVIAGSGVRAVLELAGIQDVLAKSLGSKNKLSAVKATIDGLKQLRSKEQILGARRIAVNQ